MVDYGWPRVKYERTVQNIDFFKKNWNFISIQRVQGAIWEGPEPIPELKNIKKMKIFKIIKIVNFHQKL